MPSIQELKASRAARLENLTQKVNSKGFERQEDVNEWKPTVDAAGNSSAVIRFLPGGLEGQNEDPYVITYTFGFQGPTGKYYIENSLQTIGKSDPVAEHNARLWKEGNKDEARKTARRTNYWSNIYVVKDPGNPENEGKVFKFRYGKQIFDMLKECMSPDPEDDDLVAFDPFDPWDGANFRFKQFKDTKSKFPNYTKSKFEAPSQLLSGDDKKIEVVWKASHNLNTLLDSAKFKTYNELATRFKDVMGVGSLNTNTHNVESLVDDDEVPFDLPGKSTKTTAAVSEPAADADEEEELQWFKDLENSLDDE